MPGSDQEAASAFDLEDRAARRLYLLAPDYSRPVLEVADAQRERILDLLSVLYGNEGRNGIYAELERIMRVHYAHKTPKMIASEAAFDPSRRFDEGDVILITYGDLIRRGSDPPLRVLADFLDEYATSINTVHVLPFFPSSSDRGFSVTDYEQVDPAMGTWRDVERLTLRFELMFDGVFNHVSSRSRWFQRFLDGHPRYRDFFIGFSTRDAVSEDHLRLILRPRASDLLSRFETIEGPRWVWTTFSADQIDLDYRNPQVLLRMVEVLLLYVRRGADLIRLDAATYLWRALGTSCAHLVQTHALVKLFRAILDTVARPVALVTETNVPHADNIRYFGDGTDEAQMVYNFALPPLVLFSLLRGDSEALARWAEGLEVPSDRATFFNFLSSHDGIGLLPVEGTLPSEDVAWMVEKIRSQGGLVSFRTDRHGRRVPYELNVTWWSALNGDGRDEPLDLQVDRFVSSRSIALALRGVPGIYLPSLIGSRNDLESVTISGEARSINRQLLDYESLTELLGDASTQAARVFSRMRELLAARTGCPAFHPNGEQRILRLDPRVFAVARRAPDRSLTVVATASVSASRVTVEIDVESLGVRADHGWRDLVNGEIHTPVGGGLRLSLEPFQVAWLQAPGPGESAPSW